MREPEIGNGEADLARRHHRRVAGAAAPLGGIDAGAERDRAGDRHRQQRERAAHRQPLRDQRADRRVIGVGKPEIAAQRAGDPDQYRVAIG